MQKQSRANPFFYCEILESVSAGMNLDSNSEIGIGAPNKYPCAEGHPIEVRSAACSSFSMPSAMTSTGSSLHI